MFKNKPLPLLIAAGLTLLLVIAVLLFQFVGGSTMGLTAMRDGRSGGMPENFQPGQAPDGNAPQGFSPDNNGGSPRDGNNQFPQGSMDGQSFQGQTFGGNSTLVKVMQLLRILQIGAVILIALFGILAVTGILLGKDWGRTWAIVTTILTLLAVLPSLFTRMFGFFNFETITKIVLAIAILVLCLLPKSRQPAVAAA